MPARCNNFFRLITVIVILSVAGLYYYYSENIDNEDVLAMLKRKIISMRPGDAVWNKALAEDQALISRITGTAGAEGNRTYLSVVTKGRLGNQLFELSTMLGLAARFNRTPAELDSQKFSKQIREVFELQNLPKILKNESNMVTASSHRSGIYDLELLKKIENLSQRNVTINGYVHSHRYWIDYESIIKEHVRFKEIFYSQCQTELSKILVCLNVTRDSSIFIGIHARRGDFTSKGAMAHGHNPATRDYIYRAMDYFLTNKIGLHLNKSEKSSESYSKHTVNDQLKFLIFGNDFKWNEETAKYYNNGSHDSNARELSRPGSAGRKPKIFPVKPSSATMDLCLLSLMDSVIITTGSFSWWVGYLNGGTVLYQKEFVRPNTTLAGKFNKDAGDYVLPEWIPL